MKTTAKWINQFQSVVDNGRSHAMVIDLPAAQDGKDSGPTALELALMGLSGCLSTIFAKVAAKMRLPFEAQSEDQDFCLKLKTEVIFHPLCSIFEVSFPEIKQQVFWYKF